MPEEGLLFFPGCAGTRLQESVTLQVTGCPGQDGGFVPGSVRCRIPLCLQALCLLVLSTSPLSSCFLSLLLCTPVNVNERGCPAHYWHLWCRSLGLGNLDTVCTSGNTSVPIYHPARPDATASARAPRRVMEEHCDLSETFMRAQWKRETSHTSCSPPKGCRVTPLTCARRLLSLCVFHPDRVVLINFACSAVLFPLDCEKGFVLNM